MASRSGRHPGATTGVAEHRWCLGARERLDAAFLKELMGEALSTESVSSTDDTAKLARAMSESKAKYVAVLNDRDEVHSLIDRSELLAQTVAVRSQRGDTPGRDR